MRLRLEPAAIEGARTSAAGLDTLIAGVWPEAYRIARGILRDPGLAEDAAQDACAAIARGLPRLSNDAVFPSWCYKIVVNAAISTARRRPRTLPLEASREAGRSIDRSDALDLEGALATLPVAQRAAVVAHYYAGLTSAEIAVALGTPASTVRFHLMLARRTLRKALSGPATRPIPSKEPLSDVR